MCESHDNKPKLEHGKGQITTVYVDVLVSTDGDAIKVTKSIGEGVKSFDQLAQARAKNMKYPVRKENDVAIEYWCRRVAIEYTVKPLK